MERQPVAIEGSVAALDSRAREARRDALYVGVLAAQVLAFAAAAVSGNIPGAVLVLFRALLTL